METLSGKLFKDCLTGQLYEVITKARLQPGYSFVTILHSVEGGEDIALCQCRFAHSYREVDDVG